MKKLFLFFTCFASLHLAAQTALPVLKTTKNIKPDIEKVTRDYFDYFSNIKGDKIAESETTIEYASKIIPAGAIESTIIQIKSLHNVYSWQAIMLTTESFEKASERYKQIYRQLNGSNFMLNTKSLKFKGNYDAPDESRSFASSILEAETQQKAMQNIKIEIALNYNTTDWTVKVLVYEKESDADIRPSEKNDQ